jgi:predicted phosphodiesterase
MKFAFIHQPPHFVPRWAHHSYQADKTHALFRESNVHSVFCGHIHTFDFERVDNINYLVTGGLNDIRRNTNTLKIFSKHYLSVSVKNNKVTIFRVDLDGTETLICQ